MRILKTIFSLFLLLLFTSCILSLYPFYTENDIIFEPSLLGQWESEEGELWEFSKNDSESYIFKYTDSDGETGIFKAHLAKVDGHLFLDLRPEMKEEDLESIPGNPFYYLHFIRAHSFFYIEQIEPTLKITSPHYRWVESLLEEEPDAIRHEVLDSMIVLSASTEELQEFWIKHLETKEAFHEPSTFVRLNDERVSE